MRHVCDAAGLRGDVGFDVSRQDVPIRLESARVIESPLFKAIPDRQCTRGEFDGQACAGHGARGRVELDLAEGEHRFREGEEDDQQEAAPGQDDFGGDLEGEAHRQADDEGKSEVKQVFGGEKTWISGLTPARSTGREGQGRLRRGWREEDRRLGTCGGQKGWCRTHQFRRQLGSLRQGASQASPMDRLTACGSSGLLAACITADTDVPPR